MTEAPPVKYVALDGETFSEYELHPGYSPPEDKPVEMYLAEILHELRTIRYQVQAVIEHIGIE